MAKAKQVSSKAKRGAAKKVKKAAAPAKPAPIPPGVPQLVPYFSVSDARGAIEIYQRVFGAKVVSLMEGPDGKAVMHCALQVGNSRLMLSEPFGSSPTEAGKSGGAMLYVRDAGAVFEKAVALGARVVMPLSDMFWGDRYCSFEDPFGQVWQVATHLEDVKPKELQRRMMASMAGTPPPPPAEALVEGAPVAQA